jgi:hypothetical protein
MAMGVTCLALVLNRASADDDKQVVEEQKQVIVVPTDQSKADVGENLKKALHDQLEGLPAAIQEKIRQKLKAVKESDKSRVGAHPGTLVISAQQFELKDSESADRAVAGAEARGEAKTMTLTVTVNNGELKLNVKPEDNENAESTFQALPGKPLAHTFSFQAAEASKSNAEVAKRLKRIENELKQIRKLLQKMSKDDGDD